MMRAMLLSQVEGFLETAHHRNLSRAAVTLHVTQPAGLPTLVTLPGPPCSCVAAMAWT